MNFYNLTLQTENGKEVTTLYHSENLTDEQYKGYYNAVIDELTGCARNPIIPSILTYTIVDKMVEKFGFGVVEAMEARMEIEGREGGFGYADSVKVNDIQEQEVEPVILQQPYEDTCEERLYVAKKYFDGKFYCFLIKDKQSGYEKLEKTFKDASIEEVNESLTKHGHFKTAFMYEFRIFFKQLTKES